MKFILYKDAKGEWRWRLYSTNGRIVADSGEGYVDKRDCLRGIELVRSVGAGVPTIERTKATFSRSAA